MAEFEKLTVLYLMKILLEETDRKHMLNADAICERMEKRYHVSCSRKTVYRDVDCFISSLRPVADIDLSTQILCIIAACQMLEFCDEFPGFGLCNKFGSLHRIHQEFKLSKFEISLCQIVS